MQNISNDKKAPVRRNPGPGTMELESPSSGDRLRIGGRRIISSIVRRTRRNSVRELWDWMRCKRLTPTSVLELRKSLSALDRSDDFCEGSDAQGPIFLLATGWRSGSTLLQRILVTDPKVLLWGEPLGEMALVPELAAILSRLATLPGLKENSAAGSSVFHSLATSWIATLH